MYGPWSEWEQCPPCVNAAAADITRTRSKQCLSNDVACSSVTESRVCSVATTNTPLCEVCANFANYCGIEGKGNTECVDITDAATGAVSASCECKKPWGKDENGQCSKCNVLRPFNWQCGGK